MITDIEINSLLAWELHAELGAPPVPPLGVVPDRVVGPETDPRGHRPVLLGLLRQLLLEPQSLLRRLKWRGERGASEQGRRKEAAEQGRGKGAGCELRAGRRRVEGMRLTG